MRLAPRENRRYMRYIQCPLADKSNLNSYQFPSLDAPGRWEGIEEQVARFKERYVVSGGVSTFFRNAWDLCGLED